MLLFSTVLEMNDTMTKDAFIQLVIDWNQSSPYAENIIRGIRWNGEHCVHYGDDSLWLDIQEYRNRNIIAVRYEKAETDGVVWDSDYVMNFDDMEMSIHLDRSYLEEALVVKPDFSTPHFITLLIDNGYIKSDGNLPVDRSPLLVKKDNINLLADIINGTSKHRLPVVYISKTIDNEDPVDISKLSGKLKGVAHVMVEDDCSLNQVIRKSCNDGNEYYGAIGIYYPNAAVGHKRFMYRAYDGIDSIMEERVIRAVIQYSNAQMVDTLYTWQGVSNALLRDRLKSKATELLEAENESKRVAEAADELMESAGGNIKKLKEQLEYLTRTNEALTCENQGLRAKLNGMGSIPLLYMGNEFEFYQGEIKDLVLATLKDSLDRIQPKSRRADVIQDIVDNNEYKGLCEERAGEIKKLLKNYDGMPVRLRQALSKLGFNFSEDGKHYKAAYFGDNRYQVVFSKTPSDNRSGMNSAAEIISISY